MNPMTMTVKVDSVELRKLVVRLEKAVAELHKYQRRHPRGRPTSIRRHRPGKRGEEQT